MVAGRPGLTEGGVMRALERAHPVRLETMRVPDALHGAQRDADRRGNCASGPVRDLARRLGAGDREHLGDRFGWQGRFAGRTGSVPQEAFDALLGKALLPTPDRRAAHARSLGDLQHGRTGASPVLLHRHVLDVENARGYQ